MWPTPHMEFFFLDVKYLSNLLFKYFLHSMRYIRACRLTIIIHRGGNVSPQYIQYRTFEKVIFPRNTFSGKFSEQRAIITCFNIDVTLLVIWRTYVCVNLEKVRNFYLEIYHTSRYSTHLCLLKSWSNSEFIKRSCNVGGCIKQFYFFPEKNLRSMRFRTSRARRISSTFDVS